MIFSWWKSQTVGTWLTTRLHGEPVGTDAFGNRYYQNRDGSRRWVTYNGTVEASRMIPISPKIGARLMSLAADEGSRVETGQVLAQFEDADTQENLKDLQVNCKIFILNIF